jgi:hypothetical protein
MAGFEGERRMTMKKLLFICMIALVVFTACQTHSSDGTNDIFGEASEPSSYIGVRSLAELEIMREMVNSNDADAVEQYLRSVEGGGAHSKKDLKQFLSIVDSAPYAVLIEGDITWISYSVGQSIDTGKDYKMLFITTEASNGDWVRIEYNLLEKDVATNINAAVEATSNSLLSQPMQSSDKKVTLYTETREPHPSGTGTTIVWIAEIDGVYARIVYYTVYDEDAVTTTDVCDRMYVTDVR